MILPPRGEVHVWAFSLDISDEDRETFASFLSEDERARARALRVPAARRRFEAGRGILRRLLGGALRVHPAELPLGRSFAGKPFVEGPLRFNVSHSGDGMLAALSTSGEVGVDVERVDLQADVDGAARFLSETERASLSGLHKPEKAAAFFRLWTERESLLKASGEGLSLGFSVHDTGRWSVRSWEPWPGTTAALAAEGRGWTKVDKAFPRDFRTRESGFCPDLAADGNGALVPSENRARIPLTPPVKSF